eukprot:TRINITY_DN56046_c0_g1_i2.p1 TRINITY_DN56046_c0_g1~~TRINITY_DN56046_c0_g1_i2.p1  ORF type:complete len:176 (+),score=66.10 TRINITY_DN56046_c0_g1_i2:59-586(+)
MAAVLAPEDQELLLPPEGQDVFYVCKRALESIVEQLKKGENITQEAVAELTFPDKLDEEEIMIPVDMRGTGADFDDVEQMVEKLGLKGTAEAFVKAKQYFDQNPDKEPAEERPKPMTLGEWRAVLDGPLLEGEEEEPLFSDFEGEEEDFVDDFDFDEAEGGEILAEPAAKKPKKS